MGELLSVTMRMKASRCESERARFDNVPPRSVSKRGTVKQPQRHMQRLGAVQVVAVKKQDHVETEALQLGEGEGNDWEAATKVTA